MIFQVRLFAMLREQAAADSVQIDLAEGSTVAEALEEIARQHASLAPAVRSMSLAMAVNREYSRPGRVIGAGDELALIPPVSGGATAIRPHARVHGDPLSLDAIAKRVRTDHTGAIVTFQGTTRDVERLDYEAYLPMAEERIVEILEGVLGGHAIEAAAAEHRVGEVPLGEPSVIVAVAAAHRGPAFSAAREAIDRIKAEAPIWKREIDAERATWVQGSPPPEN